MTWIPTREQELAADAAAAVFGRIAVQRAFPASEGDDTAEIKTLDGHHAWHVETNGKVVPVRGGALRVPEEER